MSKRRQEKLGTKLTQVTRTEMKSDSETRLVQTKADDEKEGKGSKMFKENRLMRATLNVT